ncbi:MAG: DUF2064 domain-containing protein [Winogradskyella sp.]|uniref:TIGR04282 family arsenosugar biosynthesis glycosyltransferase n=1 Tax=Winogradskyella sp. TaxID=1883156 RepID=UPI00385929CA
MKQGKIAILVFANNAEKELLSKSIQSVAVFDLLNSETLKTVEKTGLPYYHYSENEQVGTTFGQRFSNAIEAIYKKGYDTVISVGNDTPHLKAAHILKAANQLQSSDFVLGSSTDGGFYLMGLKKAHFNKPHFEALPWQTSKLQYVFRQTLKANNHKTDYLEALSDIDNDSDIELVLNHFKPLSFQLKKIILHIRNIENRISTSVQTFSNRIHFKLQQNKGSPSLDHI